MMSGVRCLEVSFLLAIAFQHFLRFRCNEAIDKNQIVHLRVAVSCLWNVVVVGCVAKHVLSCLGRCSLSPRGREGQLR